VFERLELQMTETKQSDTEISKELHDKKKEAVIKTDRNCKYQAGNGCR
jgi:hypothetical protein